MKRRFSHSATHLLMKRYGADAAPRSVVDCQRQVTDYFETTFTSSRVPPIRVVEQRDRLETSTRGDRDSNGAPQ